MRHRIGLLEPLTAPDIAFCVCGYAILDSPDEKWYLCEGTRLSIKQHYVLLTRAFSMNPNLIEIQLKPNWCSVSRGETYLLCE